MTDNVDGFRIGWASVDLTPDQKVVISGQFHARVSEGVRDPVTATAMAFESVRGGKVEGAGVMVSCDVVAIPDSLRDAVRAHLAKDLPALNAKQVFLNATHTHTGPEVRLQSDNMTTYGGNVPIRFGIDLGTQSAEDYQAIAARRIADAVVAAWKGRTLSGLGFGLGHATVGYNRRICYYNGETKMYGNPNTPEFSHVEAGSETSINLLYVWDRAGKLTGVVVNIACPSQVSEQEYQISADYWHETRQEIRNRLGDHVFILPQNSATGDIVPGKPNTVMDWKAQQRMWRLMGVDQRRDIGRRIANTVTSVLPYAQHEINWHPTVQHRVDTVRLTRRLLNEQDVAEASALAEQHEAEYHRLKADLEAHPEKLHEPRWYKDVTSAYRRAEWNRGVARRFEAQKREPTIPVEIHVVRIGDVAIATNPFEYYLDFGHQIKARSKAVQTLLVQHVGSGTYLPTARAAQGKSYGALPASTPVGPEGGRELANWSVDAINAMWDGTPT